MSKRSKNNAVAQPKKQNQEDALKEVIQNTLGVFQEINKVQTVSKAQVFELVRLARSHPALFQSAWELAYLKIFKIFHEKGNRKMPPKFENLATSFFTELLSEDNAQQQSSINIYNFFMVYLAEALFSSLSSIRITSARMLFHLLKLGSKYTSNQTQQIILRAVFYLIRLKVSTYKQIGIKLASFAFNWGGDLTVKIEDQLFKMLSIQDNEQIRKMALTNLPLKQQNLDRVLIRLRDKCPDIKYTVLRKLLGQRQSHRIFSPAQILRLLYDGYGNKQVAVQEDSVRYFAKFFEGSASIGLFEDFIELFSPNLLLIHPHLYTLFDDLISALINELPNINLQDFIRKTTNQLKQIGKNGQVRKMRALIWLKNIGKSDNGELKHIFEETIPSGLQLSKILIHLVKSKDIFSIYECLQIIGLQSTADEIGKNKMFESLRKVAGQLEYWPVQVASNGFDRDDVCPNLTETQIKQKKLLLSYFDLCPISTSYDLLYSIGITMKLLCPDHYEIQLKQLMADWNNPEQNTLLKEHQLAKANLSKVEAQGDKRLIETLKNKLQNIQNKLQYHSTKTRIMILCISRLRSGVMMQDFMPMIKEQLGKQDQSEGLVLLGHYCLQEKERAQNFVPLYWAHLASKQSNKLSMMVSIKIMNDFITKFESIHSMENEFTQQLYIKKLLQFTTGSDNDLRVLSIEGLCRLIFHNRISGELEGSCWMRLLLLWWQTGCEQVSARCVHTVSLFIKGFIEKGQRQVRKLSEWLCVFFKILLLEQSSRKTINKLKVTYNLKLEQFVKRAMIIASTVLKYHKESRQVIWTYSEAGAELGPQQLLIMFFFKQDYLHFALDKIIHICDFYEDAPLETLILIKKQVQYLLQNSNFTAFKKLESLLKKFQTDIQEKIQIKNKQTYNEDLYKGLESQFHQYQLLIDSQAARLVTELEAAEIFIHNPNAVNDQKSSVQDEASDEQQKIDLQLPLEENDSISQIVKEEQRKEMSQIQSISEVPSKNEPKQQKKPQKKNRKKFELEEQPVEEKPKNIIPSRTRSRFHI